MKTLLIYRSRSKYRASFLSQRALPWVREIGYFAGTRIRNEVSHEGRSGLVDWLTGRNRKAGHRLERLWQKAAISTADCADSARAALEVLTIGEAVQGATQLQAIYWVRHCPG